MTSTVTYRAKPIPRFLLPVVLVVGLVIGVVVVVTTTHGGGPPIAFLAWLAALCWNVYWWGWRVCADVGVVGVMNRQMAVVELQGRRPLLVPVRYGFGQLTQAIAAAAPHATIKGA